MKRAWHRLFARQKLSAEQILILSALAHGQTLKSHRTIEGTKQYTLHALDGTTQSVPMDAILNLRQRRLIETNHKFPAATFLLTTTGAAIAQIAADDAATTPLHAHNFVTNETD